MHAAPVWTVACQRKSGWGPVWRDVSLQEQHQPQKQAPHPPECRAESRSSESVTDVVTKFRNDITSPIQSPSSSKTSPYSSSTTQLPALLKIPARPDRFPPVEVHAKRRRQATKDNEHCAIPPAIPAPTVELAGSSLAKRTQNCSLHPPTSRPRATTTNMAAPLLSKILPLEPAD